MAAIAAGMLAAAIAGYGLYLVLVGQESTVVPAVPIGSPPGEPTTIMIPAMQGLIPLAGGVLVMLGLLRGRLLLAWLGAVLLALFAGLFVFGVGGVLLPVAATLLILLAVVTWHTTKQSREPTI